jgi:predicted metal-dependent peptidase
METMATYNKLIRARSLLLLDSSFFGCLALRLSLVENEEIETAVIDDKIIYYNPKYIDSLTLQETKGMLAHLVMHVALGHHWRKDVREEENWQKATDYAINPILDVVENMTLPPDALRNDAYKGKAAEEIYALFPPEKKNKDGKGQGKGQPQQGKGKGKGKGQSKPDNKKGKDKKNQPQNIPDPGKCGAVATSKNKDKMEQSKTEWKMAVAQVMQFSRGKLPADLQRQIEEMLESSLPWSVLLRDFIQRTAKNDFSWSRPSTRYAHLGVVLPSIISDELPQIVIAIDTSASISKEQLDEFAAEVTGVFEAYDTKITVVYCDAAVKKTQELTRTDLPLKLEPMGGGGTNFSPVFEYVEKEAINPACLVYLTDLDGTFPNKVPDYPVLWISTQKNKEVPFGTKIDFK